MLTTRTPWWNVDANAVHIRIAYDAPEYTLPAETSALMASTIQEMLEMMPEKRPSAAELLKREPFKDQEQS